MPESPTFEWDDVKAASNLVKHDVSFPMAAAAFLDPVGIDFDATQLGQGETRWKRVGMIEGLLFTVVYVRRGDAIRLVSARRANAKEIKSYGCG